MTHADGFNIMLINAGADQAMIRTFSAEPWTLYCLSQKKDQVACFRLEKHAEIAEKKNSVYNTV